MSTDVSQYLHSVGFGRRARIRDIVPTIRDWDVSKIGDFCLEVSRQLPRRQTTSQSVFSFIGNASLGGYPSPCANPSCRIESVDSIARFAALYANVVLLPDPFAEIHDNVPAMPEQKIWSCIDIATHIRILNLLEPLLEEGIVGYADTLHHRLCTECYAKAIGEVTSTYSERLVTIKSLIRKKFLDGVTVEVIEASGSINYHISGPDEILPHGGFFKPAHKLPKNLNGRRSNTPFKLTRRQISFYGIVDSDISEIIDDIVRQNYYTNMCGTSYLTHRDLDLEVIRSFEGSSKPRVTSPVSPTIFSHFLPIIGEVSLEKVVRLRRAEGAAFELYRDAISKALRKNKKMPLRQQVEFFDDIVRPEIAKIDSAVRRSRKLLVKSLTQDMIVATGAIGIGLFSGLLPPEIGAAAVGLGSLHYSPQFVKKLTELCAEPKKAAESRYYFLWKAKKLAPKHVGA